jgi:diguanylate cyclase (GGDEF)-like protein
MLEQLELPCKPTSLIDIESEQIRIIFAAIPSSLVAILLNSLLLSVAQWGYLDDNVIITWFLVANLLSAVRFMVYRRFKSIPLDAIVGHHWYNLVIITSALSGLTWGLAGIFLFTGQDLVHQIFLAFVVGGMCAGAIGSLSAIQAASLSFLVLALSPIIVQFLLINNDISLPMTAMSILFMIMLIVSAKRLNGTIIDSLRIRKEHEIAEATIRHQALYDELTDLPNRRLLLDTLKQEIANSKRHHRFGAVLFVDLDRFKRINDSLGHRFGDELLVQVAQRISSRLRTEDIAARLGGDEFVVLLSEVGINRELAITQSERVANEIKELFENPFDILSQRIYLTVSIGISLYPTDNISAEDLIQYADVAMYKAKNEGRNQVRIFTPALKESVIQYRIIEKELRIALDKDEFILYFQPQFNAENIVIGAEALLRWQHPEKGLIAPGYFIDIAEKTGLIEPIGDWVLQKSCEYLATLDDEIQITFSVNVSPRQFTNQSFIDKVKSIIDLTGINPGKLKLEITESMIIENIDQTINTMNRLIELGIRFQIDDFGTGYSSLAYLNRLPFDELKIDQSFVRNITTTPENAVIVETIINMAKNLKLGIIAEGVETIEEINFLKAKQCSQFQGFYFAKPDNFEALLSLNEYHPNKVKNIDTHLFKNSKSA